MKNVIVPLNAFNRIEVLQKGQEYFVEKIAHSGAYGIEIRRELLSTHHLPLDALKKEIDKHQLFTVYSAPVEAWNQDFELNKDVLLGIFHEANVLGAEWVKVSLGYYQQDGSNLVELKELLTVNNQIQLFIENDQTMYGGNIEHLKSFFENAFLHEVPVKMTFDSGNWHYTEQHVEIALEQLAPYVDYLHLKHVEKVGDELVTIPLPKERNAEWRRIVNEFPSHIIKALEFQIDPISKIKQYIEMVQTEELKESGEILCKN